jgi:hypothetical protein
MSLTVLESIAVALVTRLEGMVNSSTYETSVSSVIRPTRNGGEYNIEDLQIVVRQGSEEIVDELSYPGNPPSICKRQVFNLRCHVLPSELESTPIDTTINTFQADVIKCITTPANWYQFGSLAIDTKLLAVELVNEDGGIGGFNLPVEITYRHSEDDPYEVRA